MISLAAEWSYSWLGQKIKDRHETRELCEDRSRHMTLASPSTGPILTAAVLRLRLLAE